MTSALIPPVIPRRSAPGNWPRGRPGAAGPLPLPASPGQAPCGVPECVRDCNFNGVTPET